MGFWTLFGNPWLDFIGDYLPYSPRVGAYLGFPVMFFGCASVGGVEAARSPCLQEQGWDRVRACVHQERLQHGAGEASGQ